MTQAGIRKCLRDCHICRTHFPENPRNRYSMFKRDGNRLYLLLELLPYHVSLTEHLLEQSTMARQVKRGHICMN